MTKVWYYSKVKYTSRSIFLVNQTIVVWKPSSYVTLVVIIDWNLISALGRTTHGTISKFGKTYCLAMCLLDGHKQCLYWNIFFFKLIDYQTAACKTIQPKKLFLNNSLLQSSKNKMIIKLCHTTKKILTGDLSKPCYSTVSCIC